MTNKSLSILLALIMGSVFTVNGVTGNIDKTLSAATDAANAANMHQLATVLEVYYSDNGHYPNATNGDSLIDELQAKHYILNRPLNPDRFIYSTSDNGETYQLALASN